MKAKLVIGIIAVGVLSACSNVPKLADYDGPHAMDRIDVIKANKDCIVAGLRPNVEYVTKKTDSGKVLVPINVHCEPYQAR